MGEPGAPAPSRLGLPSPTVRQKRYAGEPAKGRPLARPDESEPTGRWATRVLQARTLDGSAFAESIDAALAELELLPPSQLRSRMAEELIRSLLSRSQPGSYYPAPPGSAGADRR